MKNYPLPSCSHVWSFLLGQLFFICCIIRSDAYSQQKLPVIYREFATSETHQISGICLGCVIENPERAVGNNTQDYATFKMGLAVLGTIRQTLIFQHRTIDRFTKLTVKIGTGHTRLSVRLLGQLYIETLSGDTSNNDLRPVDAQMLKIWEDSTHGELEFITSTPYDRVRITLNGGLVDINDELRIYSADQTYGNFSLCDVPHFAGEILYYSFDGHTKELISGQDLTSTLVPVYKDGMLCGRQGLSSLPCLENVLPRTQNTWNLGDTGTIGFWARIDSQSYCTVAPRLHVEIPPFAFTVTTDSITACKSGLGCKTAYLANSGQLNLYVVTTSPTAGNQLRLFVNGTEAPVPLEQHVTPPLDGHIKISLNQAQIDEMIVYKRVQSFRTIRSWYYDNCIGCQTSTMSIENARLKQPAEMQHERKTPRLFPNPTTGRLSIGEGMAINELDVSVKNTSGTAVYRTRINVSNFELPSTLPNGVYMITLTTKEKAAQTYKIVLSR
ncbi:T9SS type A sorting domain-containing protein [Chitinophaga varians]|uniref:T9SS type A sorting domain-containing protein n=1 Tax=Chitinophaga varians TaxID=2202339 RepID=UPI00165F4351|nr:T9SS type A sorting domain-containing protein [Chitinophaga varians]MBC9911752.1 T9SS type A sorting domain-containing protein [Chitinophaga varians]